jgi:hypothetical protein
VWLSHRAAWILCRSLKMSLRHGSRYPRGESICSNRRDERRRDS